MSQHYYADGAKHIDHHKEINIGGNISSDRLERLMKDFLADDDTEDASFEEIKGETATADDVTNHNIIPVDCQEAVGKVFTSSFSDKNSNTLFSVNQIKRGAIQIDLSKPFQVAMLMAVGKELNAIKATTTCPAFVRALIGAEIIKYVSDKEIARIADGMSKKLNGYKRGETRCSSLPENHLRWKQADKIIGNKIYDAMTTTE